MPIDNFQIVESTLREGEQFQGAVFTTEDKLRIADALDDFGVENIELTSPIASPRSANDARLLARRGLRARLIAHVRCRMEDVKVALDTGVHGISVAIGTSPFHRAYGHNFTLDEVTERAVEVVAWIRAQAPDIQVRFGTEDTFRSDRRDICRLYAAAAAAGAHRLGISDTVGIATPTQVSAIVSHLRATSAADIEFHAHNDTGCAIANALTAVECGATHIDTTVLGIGERNGITSLGGFIARIYSLNREQMRRRYRLGRLREIESLVASIVCVSIPFNNCITGSSAFSHKAGVHTKAVIQHPASYEIFDPADFGVARHIELTSNLTGWNALRARARELGLDATQEQLRGVTDRVKRVADSGKRLAAEELDRLLREHLQPASPATSASNTVSSITRPELRPAPTPLTKLTFDNTFDSRVPRLPVSHIADLDETQLSLLADYLNRFGFARIQLHTDSLKSELLDTGALFGRWMPHVRADRDGVTTLAVEEVENPVYVGTSNRPHLLHSDGQYMPLPPPITVLACELPAEHGGDTILVSSAGVYRHLLKRFGSEVHLLFDSDCYTIQREGESFSRPILQWGIGGPRSSEDRLLFAFRLDDVLPVAIKPQAWPIVEACLDYVNHAANRLTFRLEAGEILVFDNWSVLHGRTGFERPSHRRFLRRIYDGHAEFCRRVRFGFEPALSHGAT